MDIFEAIKERRSIRKYESRDVEEEKVRKVIDSAITAPSWANTQCWRFVIVRDDEIKEKLSETLSDSNPATDAMTQAPVLIVGCVEEGLSGFSGGEPFDGKDWSMFDMGLAVQNLMLAAKGLDLGTVPIGAFDKDKVGEILDVPKDLDVVVMTPLGYPAEDSNSSRKDLEQFMVRDKF